MEAPRFCARRLGWSRPELRLESRGSNPTCTRRHPGVTPRRNGEVCDAVTHDINTSSHTGRSHHALAPANATGTAQNGHTRRAGVTPVRLGARLIHSRTGLTRRRRRPVGPGSGWRELSSSRVRGPQRSGRAVWWVRVSQTAIVECY